MLQRRSLIVVLTTSLLCLSMDAYGMLWVIYWRGTDADSYYDPSTIRQVDGGVEVDVLTDFNGVIERPKGVKIMSMSGFEKYNCADETFSFVTVEVWDSPMASGKLVNSIKKSSVTDVPIAAGTNSAALFEILCHKAIKSN
jgi:hypothetical protein